MSDAQPSVFRRFFLPLLISVTITFTVLVALYFTTALSGDGPTRFDTETFRFSVLGIIILSFPNFLIASVMLIAPRFRRGFIINLCYFLCFGLYLGYLSARYFLYQPDDVYIDLIVWGWLLLAITALPVLWVSRNRSL